MAAGPAGGEYIAWLSASAVSRRAPQRNDLGLIRSRQFILQAGNHLVTLGNLQRQHLDVLRERAGQRAQFGHLGTAHGPEVGFKGADAILQCLRR